MALFILTNSVPYRHFSISRAPSENVHLPYLLFNPFVLTKENLMMINCQYYKTCMEEISLIFKNSGPTLKIPIFFIS